MRPRATFTIAVSCSDAVMPIAGTSTKPASHAPQTAPRLFTE